MSGQHRESVGYINYIVVFLSIYHLAGTVRWATQAQIHGKIALVTR